MMPLILKLMLAAHSVILFQGDSITDGGRSRTGNDLNHTMGQDYAYIISAQLGATYPGQAYTFINRGISGNTTVDLAARWQTDVIALKPALLSILIGVNDTNQGVDAVKYEQTYDKLISDTLTALPGIKIVLGQPFMLPVATFKNNLPAANLKLHQDAVARLAAKYHLPLVRYQDAFDAACQQAPPQYWLWDGIHPTYAGHWLMAQEWLKTVSQFWPSSTPSPSQ
jgi:lysophospholipase L1-like esterase